ncbi:hypothetical protein AX17_001512 [Amanita inopinata Kibby_2008]|nr:hypothetical protein AX17_001512 [Amanita inopinata Kibby_2008]
MTDGPLILPPPTPGDLSHLVLHSPSRIIGTPFATSSTRFEYPFPDCMSGNPSSPPNASPASSPGSSITTTSCGSPSSLGGISFTLNLPLSLSPSAQFHQSIALIAPRPSMGNGGSNHRCHSPTHPKLCLKTPPPVPPTLIKKRNRWSVGSLGWRKDGGQRNDSVSAEELVSDSSDWTMESSTSSNLSIRQ